MRHSSRVSMGEKNPKKNTHTHTTQVQELETAEEHYRRGMDRFGVRAMATLAKEAKRMSSQLSSQRGLSFEERCENSVLERFQVDDKETVLLRNVQLGIAAERVSGEVDFIVAKVEPEVSTERKRITPRRTLSFCLVFQRGRSCRWTGNDNQHEKVTGE